MQTQVKLLDWSRRRPIPISDNANTAREFSLEESQNVCVQRGIVVR